MLEKPMLVDDGWRPYQPGVMKTLVQAVRVAKGGSRLIISGGVYEALGKPTSVRLLWDPARVRVALEPTDADDANAMTVMKGGQSSNYYVTISSIAKQLGLQVERATTVPHQLVGFRLIVDLRSLRPVSWAGSTGSTD